MRLAIHIEPESGPSLRDLIDHRLAYALARHAPRITSTTIVLERGSDSVRLAVIAVLRDGAPIHLREESRDPALAVDRAAARLQRLLRLRLGSKVDERSTLAS